MFKILSGDENFHFILLPNRSRTPLATGYRRLRPKSTLTHIAPTGHTQSIHVQSSQGQLTLSILLLLHETVVVRVMLMGVLSDDRVFLQGVHFVLHELF